MEPPEVLGVGVVPSGRGVVMGGGVRGAVVGGRVLTCLVVVLGVGVVC